MYGIAEIEFNADLFSFSFLSGDQYRAVGESYRETVLDEPTSLQSYELYGLWM